MKSNYVARAMKMMREFVPYMRKYCLTDAVTHYNMEKHRSVQLYSGMVRHALVTSDYVVKWDYNFKARYRFGGCREEYKVYQMIKNSPYAYLFAEITLIEVRGYKFFVMPRIDTLGMDLEQSDEIMDYLEDDEVDFLYDDLCLHDLHNENWGMLHGEVKIIDYACVN